MTNRSAFEPEIKFPSNPFDAARIFLSAMAYPELGAGQPGGRGAKFAEALWWLTIRNYRKTHNLNDLRREMGNPKLILPNMVKFEASYKSGRRKLHRRAASYSLIGTQMVNGFFAVRAAATELTAQGKMHEAYHIIPEAKFYPVRSELWEQNTASPNKIIKNNVHYWERKLSLNNTAPTSDAEQKAKDLVKRAYLESRPVLHMAHAFNQACCDVGPNLAGWRKADFLMIMLINANEWIFQAIEDATRWRDRSQLHFTPQLKPQHMISLS